MIADDARRAVLRAACSIRIFCECKKVLDVRAAVLIYRTGHSCVLCSTCWDVGAAQLAKANGLTIPELEQYLRQRDNTIIDGREL
jgi:hypothetical protein